MLRIYRPAKTAMQSGRSATRRWVVEVEPDIRRDRDALMGWTGGRGTQGQVRLSFATREEAVAYARRSGRDYRVLDDRQRRLRPKSYADNFHCDRLGNWSH